MDRGRTRANIRHRPPPTSLKFTFSQTAMDFDRGELVRLIAQCMTEMGFSSSAQHLQDEAGISLQPQSITQFRSLILAGSWQEVCRA